MKPFRRQTASNLWRRIEFGRHRTMSEEVRHVVCPHCTSVNSVPAARDARQAKCGDCRQMLFTGHPTTGSARSFTTHIQRNDIPVVVDFWAE
jgi:thioredoxin 2